jgi:hypothetical protein
MRALIITYLVLQVLVALKIGKELEKQFFVVQFSPVCSYVCTARPKCSHQHPLI